MITQILAFQGQVVLGMILLQVQINNNSNNNPYNSRNCNNKKRLKMICKILLRRL